MLWTPREFFQLPLSLSTRNFLFFPFFTPCNSSFSRSAHHDNMVPFISHTLHKKQTSKMKIYCKKFSLFSSRRFAGDKINSISWLFHVSSWNAVKQCYIYFIFRFYAKNFRSASKTQLNFNSTMLWLQFFSRLSVYFCHKSSFKVMNYWNGLNSIKNYNM